MERIHFVQVLLGMLVRIFLICRKCSLRECRSLSCSSSQRVRDCLKNLQVISFTTPDEVDAWLGSNQLRCPGALHFVERKPTIISYGIQTNSTPVAKRGKYEDPTFKFQVPLQIAAEREIARSLIGGATLFNLYLFIHLFIYLIFWDKGNSLIFTNAITAVIHERKLHKEFRFYLVDKFIIRYLA